MASNRDKPAEARSATNDPEFVKLLERLRQQYQPSSVTENALVERMALAQWRMDRFARLQAKILLRSEPGEAIDCSKLHQSAASAYRSYQEALHLLVSLRRCRAAVAGRAVSRPGPETFAQLPAVDFAPTA